MTSPRPEQPAPTRAPYPTRHPEPRGPVAPPRPTKTRPRVDGIDLQAEPGESFEDFIARVIATAGPPTPEEATRLRQLLPLPRTTTKAKAA